jgi:LPXTG-site transpeptidase (sortase) family protein
MKRKSLALVGLASPVLIGLCIFALLMMGALSWFVFGTGDGSAITKIATVGPFFTAKILPGQATEEVLTETVSESASIEGAAAPAQTVNNLPTPIPADLAANLTDDELTQQRGFALPANSVNLLTQDGVGTRLVIPTMNLDAPILLAPIENQTWSVEHLGQAVGHLEGTAKPGSNSNLVLAAHITLEGGEYGPFAGLGKLNPGDTITVYDGEAKFDYVIDGQQRVDRTAVEVTYPSDTGQITLITCNSWDRNEGRYVERLVVKGHLITN